MVAKGYRNHSIGLRCCPDGGEAVAFLDGETHKDLRALPVPNLTPTVKKVLLGGPIPYKEAGYTVCGPVAALDVGLSL